MNWDDDDYTERERNYKYAGAKTQKPTAPDLKSLAEVDLDSALARQYSEAVTFRDWMVNNAENSNPKDVTDAIKTVNTLISNILRMQEEVNNVKTLKATETAVIETMKEMSQEVRDLFFSKLKTRMPK